MCGHVKGPGSGSLMPEQRLMYCNTMEYGLHERERERESCVCEREVNIGEPFFFNFTEFSPPQTSSSSGVEEDGGETNF